MNVSKQTVQNVISAGLIPALFFCAILAAVILDTFINRPVIGGGSITTLLPGSVYATATILKVCLVEGLILIVIAFFSYGRSRWIRARKSENLLNSYTETLPFWSFLSVFLTPLAMFAGASGSLIAQALVDKPNGVSSSYFPLLSSIGAIVQLIFVAAGIVAALISLFRRESFIVLRISGLVANILLIGLFWYFEFYALGFDQDTWAPH